MPTEIIPLLSADIGDIVFIKNSGGVRVRLVARHEYDEGAVVSFDTEYVDGDTSDLGGYGREMKANKWRIQGNKYATLTRCTD